MAEEQTINIPQLLFVLFVGGLAIRYFFFSSASSGSESSSSGGANAQNNNTRAREADVERIQQMFPQVPRRHVMWDLQRNGGSVVATTERILSGRGLENPPISFQPPLPANSSSTPGMTAASARPTQPDLIKRYNLSSKIAASGSSEVAEESSITSGATKGAKQAWSQNKDERSALLQRRREEMILAARRKMEAKVAAEAFKNQAGSGV